MTHIERFLIDQDFEKGRSSVIILPDDAVRNGSDSGQ